jgi:hypothetical protein
MMIPLLLGALGVFSSGRPCGSPSLGIAVLAARGLVFARLEHYSRLATAGVAPKCRAGRCWSAQAFVSTDGRPITFA